MANKGVTVSRKTFQNTTRTVEVTVKSIPKAMPTNKPTVQYKRSCHLQKENERIADLRNNNIEQNRLEKAKQKKMDSNFNINVTKKKRTHNWVQPGGTWGDTLKANESSSITKHVAADSISLSSHSDSGIDDEIPIVGNNGNQAVLNNRDGDNQRNIFYNGQQYVRRSENVGIQNVHMQVPPESSRNREMAQQTSKIYPINEFHEESQRVPTLDPTLYINDVSSRNSKESSFRTSKRIKTRNVSIQCKRMEEATPQQQDRQHTQVQTQPQSQPHVVSQRLLSDDAAASPFGESGIQILQQLRQRLQTVGDSESSRMLASFFESYLSVAGSGARLQGARTSHPSSASPSFPPVFETPQQNTKDGYERELKRLKEDLAIKESTIKKMKKISTQLIQHQEYLVTKKVDNSRSTSDVAAFTNNNQNPVSNSAGIQLESQKTVKSQAHSSLLQYQTENEILQDEVRRQRELIATLELQLTRIYRELESEKSRSRSANSIPLSIPLLSQLNSQRSENSDAVNQRLVTAGKKASEQTSNQSESECDSAFVEKSGSQLTSKMSSPHSGREDLEPRNVITNHLSMEHLRENQSGVTLHNGKSSNPNSLKLVPTLLPNQHQQLRFNDSHPTDTVLLGTCFRPTISDTLANAQTVPGPIPTIQISANIERKTVENSRNIQINSSVSDHKAQHSSSKEYETSHISKYAFNLPLNLSIGTRLSNISHEDIYQGANFTSVSDLEQISDENRLAGQSLFSEESLSEENISRRIINNNNKRYLMRQVDELRAAATSTPQNEVTVERQQPISSHYISSSVVGSGARMESTRLHEVMEESSFAPLHDIDASVY